MRIWVVTTSYPRHPEEAINAGVLARDLALTVASRGHEVTVVTPDKPGGVVFDDGLSGLVLPWWRPTLAMADLSGRKPADVARILSLFAASRTVLKRAAVAEPPDALIALWALPSGVFAKWVSRWTGAPFVTWYLGSDVWRAGSLPMGVRWLRGVEQASAASFADGIELADMASELTGSTVSVLRSARRMPPPPPTDLPTAIDVRFVGRYHANKGPDVLIEAFRLLAADQPGLTLVLRGDGPMREALAQEAASSGDSSVQVGGPIDAWEFAAAMATTGVLAIPSRIESMPLVLGDAIQAGVPVVVSDVGDMGDFVAAHGLGVVVPPDEPAALAEALGEVLAGEYPTPAGLDSARREMSPDAAADRLLFELLGQR